MSAWPVEIPPPPCTAYKGMNHNGLNGYAGRYFRVFVPVCPWGWGAWAGGHLPQKYSVPKTIFPLVTMEMSWKGVLAHVAGGVSFGDCSSRGLGGWGDRNAFWVGCPWGLRGEGSLPFLGSWGSILLSVTAWMQLAMLSGYPRPAVRASAT